MFELSISSSIDKQAYISKLYKLLSSEINKSGGVATKHNYHGRSHFSMAVKKTQKDYFKSKILDYIVFMIIDDYKFNFFYDKIESTNENIVYQSFLKAISIFDADIDRDVIIRQIDFKDTILVDSFYHFKLQELRTRWQKTADIININQITKNKTAMLDILKYLTTMSDNTISSAEVTILKDQLKLKKFKSSKNYTRNFFGLSNFLSEIIELNPAKINLNIEDCSDNELVEVLSKIFYDKINF